MILCMHPAWGIGHNTLKITSLGVYAAERKKHLNKESLFWGAPLFWGELGAMGHRGTKNELTEDKVRLGSSK